MTCVAVMRLCAYTCVIHPYARLHLPHASSPSSLHLLLIPLPSWVSSTSTMRPLPSRGHPPCNPASFLRASSAHFLACFFEPPLSLSLTISDLIRFVVQCCSRCDYMPEVPAASARCRSLGGV